MMISVGTLIAFRICAGERLTPLLGLADQRAGRCPARSAARRRHPLLSAWAVVVLGEQLERTVDDGSGDALRARGGIWPLLRDAERDVAVARVTGAAGSM
jgi:hypothetical protein